MEDPLVRLFRDSLDLISQVDSDACKCLQDVAFRDSDYFVAGEFHNHYEVWERILRGFHNRDKLLTHISKGVPVLRLGLKISLSNQFVNMKILFLGL